MAEIKRGTRMNEPWGYVDENNYISSEIIHESDLASFFAGTSYNKDDNKIYFTNANDEEVASLDVSEFVKSDSIVDRAWYEDGKIYIKFTNGDTITIDVEELIDQNEFADGLQVNDGIVSVLIDSESETFLSVSEDGVKVSGVQDAINAERDRAIEAEEILDAKIDQEIADREADVDAEEARAISAETVLDEKINQEIADRTADVNEEEARAISAETALDEKIDAETSRAEAAEETLDAKIDQEIADRIADVDEEETRAIGEESRIETKLDTETQRAKDAEHALDVRIDTLNDALTNEKTRATAAEQELSTRLTTEIQDRIADVNAEETRAISAETALNAKIDQEIADRINAVENEQEARIAADNRLQEAITSEVSRATAAETQLNNKIDQEIADREADVNAEEARAISAETALDEKIDAEETRAKAAEQTLQDNITAEETARINRDIELTNLIEEETTRATSKETEIEINLATEISDRKAEAIASAEYVKDDVKIYFKNKNGETLSTVNCNDFIVDGMIENVELVASGDTSVLVITWNTDGGSKVTRIDVGDIFEADNYYTKNDIDGKEAIIEEAINAEISRAISAETDLENAITAEATRAISAETDLQSAITSEAAAARAAEDANATAISNEISRAEDAEQVLQDNINAEQSRAEAEENKKVDRQVNGLNGKALIFNESDGGGAKFENNDGINSFVGVNDAGDGGIDAQIYAINKTSKEGSRIDVSNTGMYYTVGSDSPSVRMVADNEIAVKGDILSASSNLQAEIDAEEARATGIESGLSDAINEEVLKRISGDTVLDSKIDIVSGDVISESERAIAAEALKANAADVYTKGEVDGKETALQSGINANTDAITAEESRATSAETDLQDAIDAEETRAKAEEAKKVDRQVNGTNGKALIFNESDGGGAKFENSDGINSFVGVNDAGAGGIDAQIYAINKDTKEGSRLDVSNTGVYYTVGSDSPSVRMVEDNEIATKGNVNEAVSGKADAETVYTKEDVDALLLAKENEIYNLTKIVGDMGGAVTYNLPNEAGKSFNTLMNNNGTVKLTDDVTTGRFGPGITAKNNVRLNLNNHDLNVTGLTTSSAQGAIMARGTQEITIYGKGTIDAGNGICVEGNGADSVINLTGSTTVYQTDRSGGELIYCYTGTINITNGTFKNNGEDKKFLLNCYDANYRAGTAKIIVTGGKFYDFNPADNGAEGEHTSFVPEGYHVETSTDGESTVYTVKKDA